MKTGRIVSRPAPDSRSKRPGGNAAMRPSIARRDRESRADAVIDTLRSAGANLGVQSGADAVAQAIEPLEARGIVLVDRGRIRVRDRNVLRYYARTLEHLLASPSRHTH